jgi:tripartite-type tricarboxylate transporter receptor subunit TctC
MRPLVSLLGVWLSLACFGAAAQSYPDKPIRVVVSYPPGGSTDFIARILAARLPALLGQSLVIDNRGGAAGNIGTDIVAKSAPDGYTFNITAEGTTTINPHVYIKMPFDVFRDLLPVTQLIKYPNLAVVNPSLPISSIPDLAKYAKANPGKLRYAHPGFGTGQQLAVEFFKMTTGVDITSVAYKGGGPAMLSIIGNETQLSFATPPSSLPHVKTGRLRAIAVTSNTRSPAMPDIPTVAESGFAGYNVWGWVGMYAPARTSPKAIERIHADVAKVLALPEVREQVLSVGGAETAGIAPAEFLAMIRSESAMWAKVVKTSGIRIE